ncbi:HdeD family acid-resistance protein [Aliiroseovarius sp. S2029]|uniref:HdeD family acid-resistance protein n=1 Tax=Aliiroseovarius sp. S2029 TaxID=2936988 RepID=UPI0020C14437|nr:HdeD family acid-resistance protein [Aliiroseovarius sp. S2029]MCK8484266.1 HdeD family acid-resistance protein [Aliiroseovarius sp. S2029]
MHNATNATPGLCSLSRNWWAFVLRGVLALVIAVLAWFMPAEAVLAFTLVFGAFAFADGVFGLIAAVRQMREGERWGWLAFSGILGILTGLVVLITPFVATFVLAVFLWVSIAVWSIFSGAFEIVTAIRLRKEIEGEVWLGLSGIVSVLLGVLIVWFLTTSPEETLLALGWLLAIYAAIFGVTMILLGLKLRESGGGRDDATPEKTA